MQCIACAISTCEDFANAARFLTWRRNQHGSRVFSLPYRVLSQRDHAPDVKVFPCEGRANGVTGAQKGVENFFSQASAESVLQT